MRVAALGSLLLSLGGCLNDPLYACSQDSVCVINNVQGMCDLATSTCVYPGPECPSLWRDGHGNCVDPIASQSTGDTTNVSVSESTPPTSSDESESGDPSTSVDPSTEDSMGPGTSSTTATACTGEGMDITDLGLVGASSVFKGYPPILSVDGDFSTSWFSEGPDPDPTTYSWTLNEERCIDRITITGNGQHSNPAYRTDFGFGAVVVRVVDFASDVVFMEMHELDGTPDPQVQVETGGVIGSRVYLDFTGHESVDCGGFSELEVLGE